MMTFVDVEAFRVYCDDSTGLLCNSSIDRFDINAIAQLTSLSAEY